MILFGLLLYPLLRAWLLARKISLGYIEAGAWVFGVSGVVYGVFWDCRDGTWDGLSSLFVNRLETDGCRGFDGGRGRI